LIVAAARDSGTTPSLAMRQVTAQASGMGQR
jgi:hypothetical protein